MRSGSSAQPINARRAVVGRALQRALPLAGIPALGMNGAGTQCCRAVAAERYCSPGRGNGTAHRGGRAGRGGAGREAKSGLQPRSAVRDGSALLSAALPPAATATNGVRAGAGRWTAPPGPPCPSQVGSGSNGAGLGPASREEAADELFYKQLGIVSRLLPLVLVGDFNLPDICWKYNTAERKQSRRFLECVGDNFLTQLRQSDRSIDDERAPVGSRRLLRERGRSDVLVPSKPAGFGPKSQSGECPYCRKPGKSLTELPCFFKARYSSTFHPVVRSNVRRPCAETADLLAKPEGPALGVERLGRSHPSSERRRLRMLPGPTALLDLSFSLMITHKTWLNVTGRLLGKWQEEDRQETAEHAL
ncbi:uncharacterized protein [Phaenicophaeus curvirostris]|uniref:uncharacterized protein n=1 Tax=Phaenicophaeus curvirostris TaxID=33595 RepID=UPI0037F0B503